MFRLRDPRIYFAGVLCSLFGDTAMYLAAGVWVKTLTGSNGAAGLIFLAIGLPSLLGPWTGLLVDRVPRRPLMIVTNLAIGAAVLLLLEVRTADDVWLIYLVMVLYGASGAILAPAQSALLTLMLPAELLSEANAALQTIRQGLRLIGPPSGAALFALGGGASVAAVDAASFAAAAAALLLIRVQELPRRPGAAKPDREVLAGLRHVVGTTVLRQLAAAGLAASLVFGFSETTPFAIVDQGLHRPPAFLGVVIGSMGFGGLAGGISASTLMRLTGEGVTAALGLLVIAVSMPLQGASSVAAVLAGASMMGLGLPWLNAGTNTLVQRASPSRLQGRAFAAMSFLTGGATMASIGGGAVLIAVVDYRLLLGIMGAVMSVAGLYVLTRREQWARRAAPYALPATD